MLRVEMTAVVVVEEVPFWQAAGILALWDQGWGLGWCQGWRRPVLALELVPLSKQTQGVELDQERQTRAAAWVAQRTPVEVWGVPASREPGTWSPPQIGPMLDQAEEITTQADTTMWVKEPEATRKKPSLHLMDVDCGRVACYFCRFCCFHS